MSVQREDYNPLRPYHFQLPPEQSSTSTQNATAASAAAHRPAAAKTSLGSSTRDILSDLDYSDYLNEASPSLVEILKSLVDQGLWKYTSILLAQPFDMAKMLLQVQLASAADEQKSKGRKTPLPIRRESRQQSYSIESDDSGDDSASYFTSTAPLSPRTPTTRRMQRPLLSRSPSPEEPATPSRRTRRSSRNNPPDRTVTLSTTSSLTTVVSYLWQTEGAWGVWKGTNSTFIHSVLLSSFTTFLRSLFCAFFALPDPSSPTSSSTVPGGLDILSSPSPFLSLLATTSASAVAALVLAPIDIARTRLILTSSASSPRSLLPALRSLHIWTIPSSLAPATILHGALPTFISASTPLFCRARLGIDPILTPTAYAVATFASQAFELAIKLPIETALRRGQIAFANEQEAKAAKTARGKQIATASGLTAKGGELETVVPAGPFRGLVGTMYSITFEEGERVSKTDKARDGLARATGKAEAVRPQQAAAAKRKKGQGVEGLYRGWRVGAWGLIGVWGAAMLGSGKGGEF